MRSGSGATYEQPLDIDIHDGEVVILGPGPLGVALTAEAAAQTARRLAEAAGRALSRPSPQAVTGD